MRRPVLPIDAVLPELVAALSGHSAVVLRAPTGAGKTTRVPPAVLDAGVAGRGQIIVLEPRRLAARAAAQRMAVERGERCGGTVGYHVRFDRCAGPSTRILVVTPGILLRRLLDDPFLESATVLVFDEFHERGLDSDLALGIASLLRQTVRPDLKIAVMSATLNAGRVSAYLGDCPMVISEGRLFPVEIEYQPRGAQDSWPEVATRATQRLLERTDGDILVFLPGMQEIQRTAAALAAQAVSAGLLVLPLHGDLPPEAQDRALAVHDRRRIVLATNVAETSVTVEGVSAVVDTGVARMLMFDHGRGLDRLELTPIARDAADQRAGRAGRVRPGVCVRVWSEASHRQRPEQTEPEVRRVDLAGAALRLLCLGETDLDRFPWFEAPQAGAVDQALDLLDRLGLVAERRVTSMGERLGRLPVHPRLGRLLVEGDRTGYRERSALAASMLSERDAFIHSAISAPRLQGDRSDLIGRVEALEEFDRTGRTESSAGALHAGSARTVLRVRDQLLRELRHGSAGRTDVGGAPVTADEALARGLLAAFPDRVARRRDGDRMRGLMVGGKGVRLAPGCCVLDSPLFLCIDVDSRSTEAWVRQACALQRDWLAPERTTVSTEAFFDDESARVVARRRVRYCDLVLEETVAALPPADQVARVLAAAAQAQLDRALPAEDSPGGSFLLRARCLRQWMPELALPDFDAVRLGALLPALCNGYRSFEELRQADWLGVLQAELPFALRAAVAREAPERLTVPSGNRLALSYALGRAPVLAVRIQEIFGMNATPRIAGGRVPVLLHLLAPNFRPQQVTDDLASFWANTYPHVRKELRARYPKHAWPEDPWNAVPEQRPRRKPAR